MSEVRTSRGGLKRAAAGIVPAAARMARVVSLLDLKKPVHAALVGLIVAGIAVPVAAKLATDERYRLPNGSSDVITKVPPTLAAKLRYDSAQAATVFNAEGQRDVGTHNPATLAASNGGTGEKADQLYSATLPDDPAKGIKITDNVNSVSVTFKPQFGLMDGRKVDSRVHYPLEGMSGQLLFTPKGNGVKEDILLEAAPRVAGRAADAYTWSYGMEMPDYLEAKLEADGSVGIYSADPVLFGKIQYSATTDREAVEKARRASEKTYKMFSIPAPVVVGPADTKRPELNPAQEAGTEPITGAAGKLPTARFSLEGNVLSVHASGLVGASYPLSIDPTFVLSSTQDFVLGSIDDNIDLSVDGQVGRQSLNGGSTPGWTPNNAPSLAYAQFASSLVAYNGYLYLIGGGSGSTTCTAANANCTSGTATNDVRYISLNANTGALGGTAPTTWTQTSKLLTARQGLVSFGFNGYLYAVGGEADNGTPISTANSVEYAKINADGTLGTWARTGNLKSVRSYPAGAMYQGVLYVMGGSTTSANGTPVATTEYARINGDGTISNWTLSTGASSGTLTAARSKFAGAAYNGYVYVSGGQTTGAALNTLEYAAIQSDGSLGAWSSTTAFPTARRDAGMVVNNGYIYVFGGCSTRTQACGGFLGDTQYAVINADGTIGQWQSTVPYNTGGFNSRMPGGYTSYSNHLYFVGGCSAETATNNCGTQLVGTFITDIDSAGRFDNGVSSQAGAPYGAAPTVERTGGKTIAMNGYLYYVGGCEEAGCARNSSTVEYAPINADGSLGAFTVTSSLPAAAGGNAPGRIGHSLAAYNNQLHVVGGIEMTDTGGTVTPTVSSVTTSVFNTDVTTHNVVMPATVNPGDLLVILFTNDLTTASVTTTTPTGWTQVTSSNRQEQVRTSIYAKSAAGNEDGTNVNVATTGAETAAAHVYRIPAGTWWGSVNGAFSFAAAPATSGNPNPPSLTPSWGSDQNLWIAYVGASSFASVSTYPSGMNGGTHTVGGSGTTGASTSSANLAVTAATYDPGFFTMPASGLHIAYTIAIRPFHAYTPSYRSDILTATQNADGSLGAWDTQANLGGNELPAPRAYATVEQWRNYVYVLGGRNGTSVNGTVYYAPINANGTFGAWSTATTSITARWGHSGGIWGNWIYVLNGQSDTSGTFIAATAAANAVQRLTINPANGNISAVAGFASSATTKRFAGGFVDRGVLYSLGGNTGTAQSKEIAWASLDATTGAPGTFSITNIGNRGDLAAGLTTARSDGGITAHAGYIYAVGGCSGTTTAASYQNCSQFMPTATATEYYLNNNGGTGQTGAFGNVTALPQATFQQTTVAYNDRLYVIGGCTATDGGGCTALTNDVRSVAINADGSLATTYTTENPLPGARYAMRAVAYNNRMYVVGGSSGPNNTNTVWYAPISATGTLGSWVDNSSNYLPASQARGEFGLVSAGGYLYAIAGYGDGPILSSVMYTAVNADGSIAGWASTSALPTARYGIGAVAYNGVVYAVGGSDGSTNIADIYYAQIGAGGQLGSWQRTTDIAGGAFGIQAVASNGFFYVLGSDSHRTQVQYAPINANGSLGAMSTASSFATNHEFGSAVAYNGSIYLSGGASLVSGISNVTATIERAGQQAIARVGHYSKLFNTGVDTSPTQVVINGATAGLTSAVEFKFQTASQGDPVLGIAQLIRPVNFGQYYNVQALNSAGVDVGTAFNYLYQITLDDSRSGTFPDVVKSGYSQSAVTDITLYYRASPLRRLRHGASFNDEGCRSDLPTADGCVLDTATR